MQEIVVLGCSLSAQPGYADYIYENYHSIVHNLAVCAGSNDLQQLRLTNLYFDNKIDNETILLWQVTSPMRKFMVSPYDDDRFCYGTPSSPYDKNSFCYGASPSEYFDWMLQDVSLTGKRHRIWLNNNKKVKAVPNCLSDDAALQNLAMDIFQWSLIVKKVFVTVGWRDMVDADTLEGFLEFLSSKNIDTLPHDQCIVDWCRDNQQPFGDNMHPDKLGYVNWFRSTLEPRLAPLLKAR